MSGLQGFPLKMFEHGCYATCISISICYVSCCPSLYHLELIGVILGVWAPDWAAELQYGCPDVFAEPPVSHSTDCQPWDWTVFPLRDMFWVRSCKGMALENIGLWMWILGSWDSQCATFIWVEGHAPLFLPFCELIQVLLYDIGIFVILYPSLQYAVISK